MVMIMVNIHEAKTRLSALLEQVAGGDRVLICKRNQPVAELRHVRTARSTPRPLGLAKGLVELPAAFFEPLPEELVEAFEDGAVYPRRKAAPLAVVERRESTAASPSTPRRGSRRGRTRSR